MKNYITLKLSLLTFVSFCLALPLRAQHKKMPLQLTPEFGMPFTLLNKDIYSGKPLNIAKQFGGQVQLGISQHLSIGIDAQYRSYSLEKNIEATYKNYVNIDAQAIRSFKPSTILNTLLTLNYYRYNKKGNNLFEFGFGGGMQQLNQGKNILAFHNPYRLGLLDTVYQNGTKTNSALGQFTLQNTFFISKRIGLTLALKAQYAPNLYIVNYTKIPSSSTDEKMSLQEFCKTTTITQTAYNPISIIPTIGITLQLGGTKGPAKEHPDKQDDDKKSNKKCFSLNWKNKTNNNNCFDGDTLKFIIAQPNVNPPVLYFEVYLAPYSDLNNEQLLFTLPSPSSSFYINSIQLNANIKYAVIVKSIYANKANNCLQYIAPITRCPDPCKDATLPKIGESKK